MSSIHFEKFQRISFNPPKHTSQPMFTTLSLERMRVLSVTKDHIAPRPPSPRPTLNILPMYRYIFQGRIFPKQYYAINAIFKLFRYISGSHSQVFYKKAVLKYFTKFTEKHLSRSLFLIKIKALFSPQLYYEKILIRESNSTIFKHAILWNTPSTPFYEAHQFFETHGAHQFFEAHQARDFMNTWFYEARQVSQLFEACQARRFMKQAKHANFLKHAKHAILWSTLSTRARQLCGHAKHVKHAKQASTHLADSH